jgi:nucleotide-binding universal stress UspA family protein
MKKILIPIDGTPQSLDAVRAALYEGAGAIERIELVNVQPLLNRHVSRWVSKASRDAWRNERSAAALEPARKLLEGRGIAYATHALVGHAAPAIAAAARELRCDEIVVGAARRGPLGRLLANSTTSQLLEEATVPVRIVPGAHAPRFERLAVPAGLGIIALLFLADS